MVFRPLMVQPPGVVTLSMADSGCSPVAFEAHFHATFYISSDIAHGVSNGARHSCGCREQTLLHDEAFAKFVEDVGYLLYFCCRCVYRSDESHRLLVGYGDVWHYEEESWCATILIEPLLDFGRRNTCCHNNELLALIVESILDTLQSGLKLADCGQRQ